MAKPDQKLSALEPSRSRASAPTTIDLFCGAGGLSHGFGMAGFRTVAGVEIDALAATTFKSLHKDAVCHVGDIRDFNVAEIGISLKDGISCLVGGPPCQGFSFYNHKRGTDDPRTNLVKQYIRIVQATRPKWLVMENVAGMMELAGRSIFDDVVRVLAENGYQVSFRVMKSEDYGVPQLRRRVVIVGNRAGIDFKFPDPTHGNGLLPLVTMGDAISDLPILRNGECGNGRIFATEPTGPYQHEMRDGGAVATCHQAPKLSATNMQRIQHIPQYGSWRDIPFDLLPAGMQRAKRSDHTKRYGRLGWDSLSSTVLTKCDIHWGAFIHPTQDRALTVREAARLQSFSDNVVFSGSRTDQFKQVGNAVPPLMARALAFAIREHDPSLGAN